MGGGQDLSAFAKQNLIQTLLKRNDIFIVLIFAEDKPAALLTAIEGFSTFACRPLFNIHDVVVYQGFRGQGLTTLLFNKVEEIARSRNCCKITLEVLEGNHVARNAYSKLGYADYVLDPQFGGAMFWTKSLS
ncbi:GNAT family N-acetyltransferase [Psychromonas sp.]|uniref:GNAT family N-acetyltransferase n=1 Tax=Psychromonas sp. TaxID=1884585 RepID=UPI0035613F16